MPADIKSELRRRATELGFASLGVTRPDAIGDAAPRLREFIDRGRHGDMDWMAATLARRQNPEALWPEARSVVMLAMRYGGDGDRLAALTNRDRGSIAAYAKGRDYHGVVKGRLKTLAGWLAAAADADVKVFVDTAPLLEKPLAAAAGIGWQGKHTNLVARDLGSWFCLGAILTTAALAPDAPEADHCGSCRRCLDICPTAAFPAPYVLDARRCISYLTIEHKGTIDRELRPLLGNRIYGCDDCLAVCPWNKYAEAAHELGLDHGGPADDPPLAELLGLDDAAFRVRFRGTALKRTGRDRFLRNVLIAAGNSGERALLEPVRALLDDAAPLVRAMAVWALRRLGHAEAVEGEAAARLARETDAAVRAEWQAAP